VASTAVWTVPVAGLTEAGMDLTSAGLSFTSPLQLPPPPGGGGPGGGGAAGVRNACVRLHALFVSLSPARTRQKNVDPLAMVELLNVVWPLPSLAMPAATRWPKA